MNKFSPASTFQIPSDVNHSSVSTPTDTNKAGTLMSNYNSSSNNNDTDFDFGDLVTMTIVDVFETDNDGKLLSYCPTFDNRAVHKTMEVTERLRKGAGHLMERMDLVKRSPAGKSVNKVRFNYLVC